MIKQWKINVETVYAAALLMAAISGSMAAMIETAKAQPSPVPATSTAKSSIVLKNNAQIERSEIDANGKEQLVLKDPSAVIIVPGDRVVFTLHYENTGKDPASRFLATNPMPAAIQFLSSTENWAELSVDGGKTWGTLDKLTVTEAVTQVAVPGTESSRLGQKGVAETVTRAAEASDVTHIRWIFATPIQPGANGRLSYRGIVK